MYTMIWFTGNPKLVVSLNDTKMIIISNKIERNYSYKYYYHHPHHLHNIYVYIYIYVIVPSLYFTSGRSNILHYSNTRAV